MRVSRIHCRIRGGRERTGAAMRRVGGLALGLETLSTPIDTVEQLRLSDAIARVSSLLPFSALPGIQVQCQRSPFCYVRLSHDAPRRCLNPSLASLADGASTRLGERLPSRLPYRSTHSMDPRAAKHHT